MSTNSKNDDKTLTKPKEIIGLITAGENARVVVEGSPNGKSVLVSENNKLEGDEGKRFLVLDPSQFLCEHCGIPLIYL